MAHSGSGEAEFLFTSTEEVEVEAKVVLMDVKEDDKDEAYIGSFPTRPEKEAVAAAAAVRGSLVIGSCVGIVEVEATEENADEEIDRFFSADSSFLNA